MHRDTLHAIVRNPRNTMHNPHLLSVSQVLLEKQRVRLRLGLLDLALDLQGGERGIVVLVRALGVLEPVEVLQGDAVLEDEGGELAGEGDVLVALHDHDVAGWGVRVLPHPLPLQVDLVGAASVKEMG